MQTARNEQHAQHHVAMLSQPQAVAAVIRDAAGKASVASASRAH